MKIERLYQVNTQNLDIVDLLDLQGSYGSTQSLNYLGDSYMQGSGQLKRDFKKAKDFFQKSLKVDAKDVTANYKLGVIYMLGLGVERDVTTALKYFEVS